MLPLYQQQQPNYYNNMADVNKPKMQLRSGLSTNGDKTPSPATKLLINHGKPNFTIQRLPKAQNGNLNPTTLSIPAATCNVQSNNNEFVVKSTTFNGIFKPSNISVVAKQTLPQIGNTVTNNGIENEATKVVLRRAKVVQTDMEEEKKDDENVPEFIRRQRRIQERLANQNILDFENRRSGYFTHVMISPTSPNRQSFVETMASPAVKPGLEIPPPATQYEDIKEETSQKEQEHEQQHQQQHSDVEQSKETVLVETAVLNDQVEEHSKETVVAETTALNGQVEEDEVAKAIEEVNKAVEGEDDDKTDLEEHNKCFQQETKQSTKSTVKNIATLEHKESTKSEKEQEDTSVLEKRNAEEAVATTLEHVKDTKSEKEQDTAALENKDVQETPTVAPIITSAAIVTEEQTLQENGCHEAEVPPASLIEKQIEEHFQNGHSHDKTLNNGITISHTNGLNGPSLPSPDPKGEKGVNFEPKTVVSFSQELGNNDNKYPDTVKVLKDVKTSEIDSELKELTKLKFEINADDHNIEVKPVLINETA